MIEIEITMEGMIDKSTKSIGDVEEGASKEFTIIMKNPEPYDFVNLKISSDDPNIEFLETPKDILAKSESVIKAVYHCPPIITEPVKFSIKANGYYRVKR